MRIRPYISSLDFPVIRAWITDERSHAMWCANRFSYPLTRENFDDVLCGIAEQSKDCPFVATTDRGEVIGFFCFSVNSDTDSGMLKFVIVSPEVRGKGFGCEMIQLAVKYAFEIAGALSVHLCVFTVNTVANKCYESAGFTEVYTEQSAFRFMDETWNRRNMEIQKR